MGRLRLWFFLYILYEFRSDSFRFDCLIAFLSMFFMIYYLVLHCSTHRLFLALHPPSLSQMFSFAYAYESCCLRFLSGRLYISHLTGDP